MHPAGVMLVAQLLHDEQQRTAALQRLWNPRISRANASRTPTAERSALDVAGLMRLRFRFGT